jgi:PIN domain nuclease of toxin-antitoxin system
LLGQILLDSRVSVHLNPNATQHARSQEPASKAGEVGADQQGSDPFVLLLITQAQLEHLQLLTVDQRVAEYGSDIHLL